MSNTEIPHGISNGHWERSESRAGWLLLLARMGIVELHSLGELARTVTSRPSHPAPAFPRISDHEQPVAAE